MSECKGVRCDRCDARALVPEQGSTLPDGWSVVQAARAKPFHKSTHDLCPTCTEGVLAALRRVQKETRA
jgi:hypothetical protein